MDEQQIQPDPPDETADVPAKKRGRPPKSATAAPKAWRNPDGTVNRDYFVEELAEINRKQKESLNTDRKALAGYEQLKKGVLQQAKLLGLTEHDLLDSRKEQERVAEAIERLVDNGADALLEETDETITAIEKSLIDAVEVTHEHVDDARKKVLAEGQARRLARMNLGPDDWRKRHLRGKRWLSLLDRLRRLRTLVRMPVPPIKARPDGHLCHRYDDAYEASWPWRIAIYVYRSDKTEDRPDQQSDGRGGVFRMSSHHGKMAFYLWRCENGIQFYTAAHDMDEVRSDPSLFQMNMENDEPVATLRNRYVCRGVIIVCPPRHGKSTLGTAWMLSRYIRNPRMQSFIVHAIDANAIKNFRHIKAAFDPSTPMGRRCHSIFGLQITKEDNRENSMRLANKERTRDPQALAKGVRSAVGGANTDVQWWDDPVNPEEAQQPDVRESTFRKLTQQFMQRQQGEWNFVLATATIWHFDDAVNRLIEQARAEKLPWGICMMAAGGPKTLPPFEPVWPEAYPASWLREKWYQMQDPAGYAAQYMANPKPDETRIIKALAYYDPTSDEHKRFVEGAECHLSLDPAATSREEKKRKTDKAGLVYAGIGDVVVNGYENGEQVTMARRVCRVLDVKEFFAGPSEAVEEVGVFCANHKVEKIHVEVVTFSTAIVEMLKNRFGLSSSQVISHGTGNKSKELRLRAVASMLDDSTREEGLYGAVVEFPGVWQDVDVVRPDGEMVSERRLVCDPRFEWAAKQILDFGSVAGDHAVDALTQLLKHVQSDVQPASGAVTQRVQRLFGNDGPPSRRQVIAEFYEQMRRENDEDVDPWARELVFLGDKGV